jgi:hypothetical protein
MPHGSRELAPPANVIDGPFTTLICGERTIHYVAIRSGWAIEHVVTLAGAPGATGKAYYGPESKQPRRKGDTGRARHAYLAVMAHDNEAHLAPGYHRKIPFRSRGVAMCRRVEPGEQQLIS